MTEGITPAMRKRVLAAVSDLRFTEAPDTPINLTAAYQRGETFYRKVLADDGGHNMFEWELAVSELAHHSIVSFFRAGFDHAMRGNSPREARQKEAA